MNGIRKLIIVSILFILAVMAITYYTCVNRGILNVNIVDDLNHSNSSLIKANGTDLKANVTEVNTNDNNLVLPPKEVILNCINWSNYPLLRNPYIHNYDISDPTFVIDHKFLYVTICADAIDVSNETEVLREISGVASEMKKVLGQDSGPNVWVTVDGVLYYAAIMPYETDIWSNAYH